MARWLGNLGSASEGEPVDTIIPGNIVEYPRQTAVRYFAFGASASNTGLTPEEATTIANAHSGLGGNPGALIGVGAGTFGALTLLSSQHLLAPFMTCNGALVTPSGGGNIVKLLSATSPGSISLGVNCSIEMTDCSVALTVPTGASTHTRVEIWNMSGIMTLEASGRIYLDVPRTSAGFQNNGDMLASGPGVVNDNGEQVIKSALSARRLVSAVRLSAYTADPADDIILADTASNGVAVTLAEAVQGAKVTIKDDANNAATNNITVSPAAGDTINGVTTAQTINTNGGRLDLVAEGTDWRLL